MTCPSMRCNSSNPRCQFFIIMSEPDVEIDVEIDDGVAIVIGGNRDTVRSKRRKLRENQISSVPEAN